MRFYLARTFLSVSNPAENLSLSSAQGMDRRIQRYRMLLATTTVLSLGIASTSFAQSSRDANPLRPAKQVSVASISDGGSAAVGSAVRVAVKRTPDRDGPVERSALVQREATSNVVPANYRRRVTRPPQQYGYRIPHETHVSTSTIQGDLPNESILDGTVTVHHKGHEVTDGGVLYEDGAVGKVNEGNCGGCHDAGCVQCCLIPCPCIPWDNLTIFGGVQGFTGPANTAINGTTTVGQAASFGFHEGFNWGAPLPCSGGCLGMQAGARFTQSNLSGAEFTPDIHTQMFLTGGLFRRVDWGLQGGVAFDYLADDWYSNSHLTQLRGELSWVFPCGHELGFWGTFSTTQDTVTQRIFTSPTVSVNTQVTWQTNDLYAFFYRHRFQGWEGATGRLFAGFSGTSDGFLGGDLQVPLGCNLALQTGFAYLVPEQAKGPAGIGNEQESWNVAFSLVWYPGGGSATSKNYFAPLFNVADNGSMLIDRVP